MTGWSISSGHGKYVRGASGVLDEVDCARAVVEKVAEELQERGVEVTTFHDDTSQTQSENLATIVDAHNAEDRDIDVSVHFNAYVETTHPMGCEVLYVTQERLATRMSGAIAACGFINRGAKKRTDLYFLNQTTGPAILIEVCFVDSASGRRRVQPPVRPHLHGHRSRSRWCGRAEGGREVTKQGEQKNPRPVKGGGRRR